MTVQKDVLLSNSLSLSLFPAFRVSSLMPEYRLSPCLIIEARACTGLRVLMDHTHYPIWPSVKPSHEPKFANQLRRRIPFSA